MLHRLLNAAVLAAMLCCASVPVAAQDTEAERLRIHGSNTIGAEVMPRIVDAWLRSIGYTGIERRTPRPDRMEITAVRDGESLVVEIDRRGSANGFQALVDGNAELAMMARAPTASERDAGWQLGDLGSPEQEFTVALDGLAIVVNDRNPVRKISVAQLRDIAAGRIRSWSQLGGEDALIHVHAGPEAGGSREFLQQRVMQGGATSGAFEHARLRQAARAAAEDRHALAIVELTTRIPPGTRTLAVSDGGAAVLPTRLNVASEDYPLVRRYRLYGAPLMSALGRSLALYAVGRDGQRAVEAVGLQSVMLRTAIQPGRLPGVQAYREAVAGATRLPVGMRFNMASLSTLFESRSALDMERLVAFMRLPENQGRSLVVVAFADHDPGNRLLPTMLSNERADMVAGYLTRNGIPVTRSVGLGDVRPLAGGGQRDRNERVEVWLL
ncbi:phosphate ABC transporter substrate-binding protein, PhoT family [Pseudoxanthomonas sp. CF385]|uniref:substrate-binding domain-containing protein n=1 Tax=Pseudoxanthomonas sp. CF385 TaxID=1881042 RepID=UPI000885FCBD|nr:substrate-binding domain-containing protein [Pseudoxanthomonas sp. CF385]SDQ89661.1 phosphate ABC transporter substrate-binding protein, PhoT family [Pseudoxanthomonas sp. CF385]